MVELTQVNSLPPEILIRIFHIVVAEPCELGLLLSDNNQHCPRHPDYLAQVCTLWRRIAISSRSLWYHIDLSPNKPHAGDLVTRADTYLVRAGDLPIELHIAVKDTWHFEYDELYRLISLASGRTVSLELNLEGPFRVFHHDIFGLLFRQRPALTKLVLRSNSDYCNNFLVPNSFDTTMTEEDLWPLELDSTEEDIERSFTLITVLYLRGIFPLWSSAAYRGLVDLRLLSTGTWSHIREAELIAILSSSPGLKILHFGLEIRDATPPIRRVNPVKLQDLQVVKIFPDIDIMTRTTLCPGSLLQLLAPGTKPLRLSFEGFYIHDAPTLNELERFLTRSRVTRLYTQAVLPPLNLLLRHSNNMEQVVLDYFESSFHTQLGSNFIWLPEDEAAYLPRLKSLHVTRSALFDSELHELLKCCPDGIVLNSCNIYRRIDVGYPATTLGAVEMIENFPTVRIIDHTPYPEAASTAEWDILD
ncbi:hypothetical protein B0J17DRAFT_667197 [Rhizoctonia solani]|nr:hypothetical protein B0J17DRAFT_667197 [Rhizoctonia solani]